MTGAKNYKNPVEARNAFKALGQQGRCAILRHASDGYWVFWPSDAAYGHHTTQEAALKNGYAKFIASRPKGKVQA